MTDDTPLDIMIENLEAYRASAKLYTDAHDRAMAAGDDKKADKYRKLADTARLNVQRVAEKAAPYLNARKTSQPTMAAIIDKMNDQANWTKEETIEYLCGIHSPELDAELMKEDTVAASLLRQRDNARKPRQDQIVHAGKVLRPPEDK